jgi:uncharacterized protein involved in type VI secretion and phage assembly
MASYNLSGPGLNQLKSKTDTVNVTQIRGEEALSEPFRYEVRFTVEEEELQNVEGATPNFDEVVGKTVTLELAREKRSRTVAGIVTKIQQDGIGTGGQLSTRSHLMVIRPTLWRLHLSRSNRTFSNRKAVTPPGKAKESRGVLNVLLRKAGYGTDSIETDLTEKHENRKRVSQKGETDLEFFDRVAQEAGVVYYFKGNGTLMLVDHDGKNAYVDYERSAQTGTKTTNTLRAVSSPQKRGQEGVLDRYSLEQNVTPSYVEARAVDFNQSAKHRSGHDGIRAGSRRAHLGGRHRSDGHLDRGNAVATDGSGARREKTAARTHALASSGGRDAICAREEYVHRRAQPL